MALLERPKYFWLLSTNDFIQPGAVKIILDKLQESPQIDLLAMNGSGLEGIFSETAVLNPPRSQMSYGVISGVVYDFEKIGMYFNYAPFFPWTGWSQLSVLEAALRSRRVLQIATVPHFKIYRQNERSTRESGAYYAHSFFGMLILGSIFEFKDSAKRSFIRNYVWRNFYNIGLYSRNNRASEIISSESYLSWNQLVAESIIRRYTPMTYLLYLLFRRVKFYEVERFVLLKKWKQFFDKRMNGNNSLNMK